MCNTKHIATFLLLVVQGALIASLHAQPRLAFAPSEVEILSLPPECKVRLADKKTPAMAAEWNTYQARYGRPVWDHYHHYCFALNFMNRTQSTFDKKEKRFNLQQAINNYNYLLKHWPPNGPLTPLAQTGKMRAEHMLKLL